MNEIILFSRALNVSNRSVTEVNQEAVKKGFVVHQDCCNDRVLAYLQTLPNNYNTTFYKSWNDVVSKSRLELAIDQLVHYASTYGTGFEGEAWIPNDSPAKIEFKECKLIGPISKEEIQSKIQGMFNSGIALEQHTIDLCLELMGELSLGLDVESIRNKEVKMYMHQQTGTLPVKAEEMVRYLVYLHTAKTLLIKDWRTIATIKGNPKDVSALMEQFGMEKLSGVFNRFKPLFLAMKGKNAVSINKLRRVAKNNHKPYEFGFWETVLSNPTGAVSEARKRVSSLSNYKKVALMQAIQVRYAQVGIMPVLVRNQKLYVKEHVATYHQYYNELWSLLYNSLVESLSAKKCKVKLPEHLRLVLPTSEKSFIGNIPLGSFVDIRNHDTVVGINWKGTDGADDLDLSLIDENRNKFGWNASYYSGKQDIIYSGDVTSANPEATELMFCKSRVPDAVVQVNMFRGAEESKFTLFFAQVGAGFQATKNGMVDPNDIIFSTELTCKSKETLCGMFAKGRYVFANIRTGDGRVSNGSSVTDNFIRYTKETADTFIEVKDVLGDAGFEFTTGDDADLDLSVLDKSALINLLA